MEIPTEMLVAQDTLTSMLQQFPLPGVLGIDIGLREDGAELTDELAIRIFLTDERDVPFELVQMTQAVEFPVVFVQRAFTPLADNGQYDPVVGGVTIRAAHGPLLLSNGAGTIGGIAEDLMFGGMVGVSCAHVVAESAEAVQQGDPIFQPDNRRIGSLYRWSDSTDTAVFTIDNAAFAQEIADIGSYAGMARANVGDLVRKRGRTTLLTTGKVSGVGFQPLGIGTPRNSFEIWSQGIFPPIFADYGDSGSIIVNEENKVVGILTQLAFEYSRIVTVGVPPSGGISVFATQMVGLPGVIGAAESVGITF
ncbi:S1 family peptidase [Arthrobacter sp. LAR12-1-1.1]|uniref:S1 family peptidase n=1 Tax=Arthrobacter sp. LAR12-1-1.1 TaxID=3135215 RepID=UPI0034476169